MKNKVNIIFGMAICIIVLCCVISVLGITSCSYEYDESNYGSYNDVENMKDVANKLQYRQPTPTDIDYSLERYNLIRRTYWVNGQREKANSLVCEVEKPLGYIVLFGESGAVIGSFVVDGKVSSLNSFLTPDSEYYEKDIGTSSGGSELSSVDRWSNKWLADVDGSYAENDNGIFFFTPDSRYIEWSGTYLYSDIPFEVENPILKVGAENE